MKNEKVEYSNEWCKYEFTTEEKRDIAETLAIKTKDLEKAEDEIYPSCQPTRRRSTRSPST